MSEQTNLERIEEALKALEAEGLTHIKPEYKKGYPRFRAIGLAIASVTNSAKDMLNIAYSALEDHNYHDLCAVIEWAYPLYNQTFHERDLMRLSRLMNKRGVTVLSEWDEKTSDYKTKVINVRIVFEDVTDHKDDKSRNVETR